MNQLQQAAERLVKADEEWNLLDGIVRDATGRREMARIEDQDAANAFGVACGLAAPQGGTDIGRAVTIARTILAALREVQADTVARILPQSYIVTPEPSADLWHSQAHTGNTEARE